MRILCDLHMHSALSPCALEEMSPNNMVNMALLQELTAIAVTDHNSCRNAAAVMEAAMGTGLVVVPGMEVQTREEVHMVTLFQNLEDALAMQEEVYAALPDMKAPAKIRNKQLILDCEDEIIGYEDKLLGFSCSMTLEQVVERTAVHHGLAIPAHIDRKSCSILSNLGFIPENLYFPVLELSMYADRVRYEGKYPNQRLISASDAHELGFVGMAPSEIRVETVSAHGILKALSQGRV
ncbi:MAG: PHP domain-containing protein [Firmicutes bacterium]|nr:PHP domain-containing protein [Bacillota bacterium]